MRRGETIVFLNLYSVSSRVLHSRCVGLRKLRTPKPDTKGDRKMFISKNHLSRRAVLRGLGVTISLPLLEAMVPAQTPLRQTAAAPKTRLACIEIPHGAG